MDRRSGRHDPFTYALLLEFQVSFRLQRLVQVGQRQLRDEDRFLRRLVLARLLAENDHLGLRGALLRLFFLFGRRLQVA